SSCWGNVWCIVNVTSYDFMLPVRRTRVILVVSKAIPRTCFGIQRRLLQRSLWLREDQGEGPASADDRIEFKNWQQYCQHDAKHHNSHNHNDDRLDQRGQTFYTGFHLAVVGIGNPQEHVFKLTAFLPNRDHVGHQRREIPTGFEWTGNISPFTNSIAGRIDRLPPDRVIHHATPKV